MNIFPFLLLISLTVLGLLVGAELIAPGLVKEGFENAQPSYWAQFVSPRSDIGPRQEDSSVIRDPRYFNEYADVGRLGVAYDFCRMLATKEEPDALFFACALAGTDKLDSTSFRTANSKKGFRLSYDDYMRDINGDGRADYCRILKIGDGSWQPMCQRATDTGFDEKETVDPSPPDATQTLLTFFNNNVLWLRMMHTLNDYTTNVRVLTAGSISLDETPRRDTTEGLSFNGINQFLRLTDTGDLLLGNKVPLRAIRAVMVWVRFDAFTNNAKIFDFGNGKGQDNFFLGILGKGDPNSSSGVLRASGECANESTVPDGPSGAQSAPEMSPQRLMETTAANVNEFDCKGFEVYPRKLKPTFPPTAEDSPKDATHATLIYEVWEKQSRRMRIKANGVVPLRKWTHICITTTNSDAFRPDLALYINGEKILSQPSAFLPAASKMTNCYIGKSNWANAVSQYEDRDELFKGAMFDFRMYQGLVPETMIQDSYTWGKEKLGLE